MQAIREGGQDGRGRDPSHQLLRFGALSAGAWCYTIRSQNTHGTAEREVLYPWHPWAGQSVHVHEVIEKAGRAAFRCSLTGVGPERRLDVPARRFDRVAGQSWQLRSVPVASGAALAALAALLSDAAEVCDSPSQSQDPGAASDSPQPNSGDAHATPVDTAPTRPLRSAIRSGTGSDAGHRPGRLGNGLCPAAGQRPPASRPEGQPQ